MFSNARIRPLEVSYGALLLNEAVRNNWQVSAWDSLVWSLQNGNCVLMLGDEASRSGTGVLRDELATLLAEEIRCELHDFAHVARRFELANDRAALERKVTRFYQDRKGIPSKLQDELAALPFNLVISSCHDTLMQRAFGSIPIPKRCQVALYNFARGLQGLVPMGTPDAPLVYHLFGSIAQPQSLVLTETDLLNFLVKIVAKQPGIPENIQTELQQENKTFLFLGFGIRHWYLRILLHVLKVYQSRNRSYALERLDNVQADALKQTAFFYQTGGYRIEVYDGDLIEFVSELRRRWEAEGDPAPEFSVSASTFVSDAPGVFLSYAHDDDEDQAAAKQIHAELTNAGLNVWFDDRSLEVGDDFDRNIEKAISKASYYVLLLSPTLVSKVREGGHYINREITFAEERKTYWDDKFILPVQIRDSDIPDRLKEVHIIKILNGDTKPIIDAIRSAEARRHGRTA